MAEFYLTQNAISYAIRQLLLRAGVDENDFPLTILYGHDLAKLADNTILILRSEPGSWESLASGETETITYLNLERCLPTGSKLPFSNPLPIPLWGRSDGQRRDVFAERVGNNSLVIYVDILAATFYMLSRYEESTRYHQDPPAKFSALDSIAYRYQFLDIPLVDQYASVLRAWIESILPSYQFKEREYELVLTHDIDTVSSFCNLRNFTRTFAHEIIYDFRHARPLEYLQLLARQTLRPEKDEIYQNIHRLAQLSEKHDLKSRFYFMAAEGSRYDSGYDPAARIVKKCVKRLQDAGHEIGFHAGFYSFNDETRFKKECSRLVSTVDATVTSGRQHYLRFNIPQTWQIWESAGFTYDSSLGYHDVEGFRCGTCVPYHPFDLENDHEMKIIELPLIIMDVTLRNYQKYSLQQAQDRIRSLAERCRQVQGTFVVLWHNTSCGGRSPVSKGWDIWFEMLQRLLAELV